MKLATVIFACNDEHGAFEGCVRKVEFENLIELEAVSITRPPRIAFIEFAGLTRLVRVSGRVFPIRSYRNYVGNVAFAAVQMEPAVATEMLNFLKSKAAFTTDGVTLPTDNVWRSEGRFSVETVEASCSE